MNKLRINSSKVWIAENASNGNLQADFVICDFGTNKNGVRINRDTIEEWMQSLIAQPLVGKIVKNAGGEDFAGHEQRVSFAPDENGKLVRVYTYDTNAVGVFTDVQIAEVDSVECIIGRAEIWNRYPRAVQLIKSRIENGELNVSWEIENKDYTVSETEKVINDGVFLSVCLLGSKVAPAYDSARLIDVASVTEDEAEIDDELYNAIREDIEQMSNEIAAQAGEPEKVVPESQQHDISTDAGTEPEVQETEGEQTVSSTEEPKNQENSQEEPVQENQENSQELSALTSYDLRRRIEQAIHEKIRGWCWLAYWFPSENAVWAELEDRESELDYMLFSYSVEGDTVVVDDGTPVKLSVSVANINDVISQKDAAIASAVAENAELKAQIEELSQIKAEYDKILAEKEEAETKAKREELRAYAAKSGLFTEGELKNGNAAKLINALDTAGINQMIADRYMEKIGKQEVSTANTVEVASANPVTHSLMGEDDKSSYPSGKTFLQMYIGK